jgi:hypothetical protein
MTTATTATVVDMTTDAGFRTWVAEVITILFTTLGVTQTSDTGQINTGTVTRPAAANTSAGYVVGRFNDTAQGTSPIFFKLEFGTAGTASTSVQMWITVGTGSNGSGTITGTVMNRCGCGGNTPGSNTVAYTTRACYSTSDGVLWLAWKYGANSTGVNATLAGFVIARSNDNTGAPTTDAVLLLTNAITGNSNNGSNGFAQAISYLTSTAYNTVAPWNETFLATSAQIWGVYPFNLSSSLFSGNTYAGPCFQFTPVPGVSNWYGLALLSELALGSVASITIVGSTAHTYIQAGNAIGTNGLTGLQYPTGTYGLILPWE